jgi:hypothetical protein
MSKATDNTEPQKKRPYKVPRLLVHGDLKTLAMAKGGSLGDGGGSTPKTKTTSGPG